MNSDTVNPNNRRKVYLDVNEIQDVKYKYSKFKQIFDSQQSRFPISDETTYYIISVTYLKDWIEYSTVNDNQRFELPCINQDLVDAGGQLKKGLVEKQDFQIINQNIYNLIRSPKGYQIKRNAVIANHQKKVPIYLEVVRYLKLDHKDVSEIDHRRITAKQLLIRAIQFPFQDTIQNLISEIRKNQNISLKYKIKLWRNNQKDTNVEQIYAYIKQKTRSMLSLYRFEGLGKCIDNDGASVADLNLETGEYFIAEVSDQYYSYFFKDPDQAKCQGCYKMKKLPFKCGCKEVAYCTEECQQRDKRFHMRDCKFVEQQEMNEEIQMIITPNSMLGRVGLSNLGNTCFMNSCLQCLSNTTLLTQYFLNRYYEKQINKDNVLGSKGKLARNYAKFIKNMWCSSQSTFSPYNLKGAVAKLNNIFSGYAQHDSQQFFSYLADGIHEDLNRVVKKPYVESVDSKNRPDNIVALESWIAHTQRNQSIIVDIMTGQYKSKVICPTCSLQSITFDPFTTISLPIPQQATPQILTYYIIFQNNQIEAQRMSFQYAKADTEAWLQNATKLLNRSVTDFKFYVLSAFENIYGFDSTSKNQILHKVSVQKKFVFLLELTPEEKAIKQKIQLVTRFCKKSSYFSSQYDNLWFKRPFFFEKKATKISDIATRMIKFLYKISSFAGKLNYETYSAKMQKQKPFVLVLKYKKTIQRSYTRVETDFAREIELDKEDLKLEDVLKDIDINDCELDVRFTRDTVKMFDFQQLKSFKDTGEKLSNKKKSHQEEVTVTLDQCFSVFQQKQKLDPGNQWYCPKCKQHKQATKQMTIYKAPQILILHLKRFKSKGIILKQKNETIVDFPLILNLKKYVIDPTPISSYINELKKCGKYLEPAYTPQLNPNSQPEYELYAISNHYGGLGGGHYTAYAKNNDKWMEFNDSSVRKADQDDLKGSSAYILFYRRRDSLKIV